MVRGVWAPWNALFRDRVANDPSAPLILGQRTKIIAYMPIERWTVFWCSIHASGVVWC
jgi:hypothetical protein